MPREIGHVKNPLTVIAIFAGIAETSGAIVLPLLDKDIQGTFVWFLMFFPCLLIVLFFGVLYRKYHVLYAPSDYKSDKSFMDMHFTARNDMREVGGVEFSGLPQEDNSELVEPPVEQATAMGEPVPPAFTAPEDPEHDKTENIVISDRKPNPSLGEPVDHLRFLLDGASISLNDLQRLARKRVLDNLVFHVGGSVRRDVQSKQFPNIRFDAVIESSAVKSVVEFVEMTSDSGRLRAGIKNSLKRAEVFWDSLNPQERGQFVFQLALMHGPGSKPMREEALKDIADLRLEMPFRTSVMLYEYDAQHMISYNISP
ncbi:hypothetical protein D7M10_07040 [Pseudomonas fluorescens]|nr:hypothetical protein D7M10_07040 [Pseudomonas fluorescens]